MSRPLWAASYLSCAWTSYLLFQFPHFIGEEIEITPFPIQLTLYLFGVPF